MELRVSSHDDAAERMWRVRRRLVRRACRVDRVSTAALVLVVVVVSSLLPPPSSSLSRSPRLAAADDRNARRPRRRHGPNTPQQSRSIVDHIGQTRPEPSDVGRASGQYGLKLGTDAANVIVTRLRLHLQEEGQFGHLGLHPGIIGIVGRNRRPFRHHRRRRNRRRRRDREQRSSLFRIGAPC